jgi:hypothetical protein
VFANSPSAYNLLNSNNDYTPSSSSIVSSTPTTPLIYNATNYENLLPSASSSKTVSATSNSSFDALLAGAYSGLYGNQSYGTKLSSVPPTSSGNSPNTSCSSTSNMMQHKHQEPSLTSSSSASNYLNYDQSLDEQRKTIDDQLKKLDNQLLTKVSELTLIQQHHIQLQQQQNRNLKSKNAALIHNSRASSLSLCTAAAAVVGRNSVSKTVNVANSLKAQSAFSSSMQSLPVNFCNLEEDEDDDDDDEQEVFY